MPDQPAAFYAAPSDAFLRAADDEVYAPLADPHNRTLASGRLSAWRLQLRVPPAALKGLPARSTKGSVRGTKWTDVKEPERRQ
jgi:hypothetical protein